MDQNQFINTYIDIIINSLLEHVKANLQLQTQVKVNESVVVSKDQIIESLTQQLNENKAAEDWKIKYDAAEANYSAILGKLKHMDTLLSQVNEMKKIILEKDSVIEDLKKELSENQKLPLMPKVINTKTKKQEKTLDDF